MPKARAPSAPWVQVCESVATAISPGRTNPSSEAMVCSIPSPSLYIVICCCLAKFAISLIPLLTMIEQEGTVWSGMNATLIGSKTFILFPASWKTSPKSFWKFSIAGGPITSLK